MKAEVGLFSLKKKKNSIIYIPHRFESLTSEVSHFIYFLIDFLYVFLLAARWVFTAARGLPPAMANGAAF